MKIKLLEDRKYRGFEYKKGDVIEVAPSLGGNMMLNGIGVRVGEDTKATVRKSQTVQKDEFKKDKKDESKK